MRRLFPILNRLFPKSSARDFPLPPKVEFTAFEGSGLIYVGGSAIVVEKTAVEVVGPPSATGAVPFRPVPEVRGHLTVIQPEGVIEVAGSADVALLKKVKKVNVVVYGKFGVTGSAEWQGFDRYEEIRKQDEEDLLLLWIA